jgi:hypothetical protein
MLYGRDARKGSFRNDPQDAIIAFLKENPQYNSILIKENQPTLVEVSGIYSILIVYV